MKEKLLALIIAKHKKSGGNCGSYIAEINVELGVTFQDIKTPLNQLFKEDKIEIREGSRGRLIFYKKEL